MAAEHDKRIDESAQAIELVRLLMGASTAIGTVVGQVLTEFAVTPSAAGLLWTLDPATGPHTMREIAQRLGCDPSTVSLTADKLEEGGLVARQAHPTDGRKRTLALTARGHELWAAISARLQDVPALARLEPDERRQLAGLLTKALT